MPIYTPPANVITGGTIQATDVSFLYNAISGTLDSQNIKTGGLLGTNLANNTVAIGQIKNTSVSTGVSPSVGNHSNLLILVLPSGAYSFFPGISTDVSATTQATIGGWRTNDADAGFTQALNSALSGNPSGAGGASWVKGNTTPQAIISLGVINPAVTGASSVATATAFYIQTSPPYNLGDGDIPIFIFALVHKSGDVVGSWIAPDPPWAKKVNPKLKLSASVEEAMADPEKLAQLHDELVKHAASIQGIAAMRARLPLSPNEDMNKAMRLQIQQAESDTFVQESVTQEMKNEDMAKIPHPFIFNDLTDHTVVMLDPMAPATQALLALHAVGENVPILLHHGHVKVGNTSIKRAGPPGVIVVDHKFKNSKG